MPQHTCPPKVDQHLNTSTPQHLNTSNTSTLLTILIQRKLRFLVSQLKCFGPIRAGFVFLFELIIAIAALLEIDSIPAIQVKGIVQVRHGGAIVFQPFFAIGPPRKSSSIFWVKKNDLIVIRDCAFKVFILFFDQSPS